MMKFDDLLRATQEELFSMLLRRYREKSVQRKGEFLLVRGEAPVMLIAHLDTVHRQPVREICRNACGNILMSPQGIGGDDRCGVYALNRIYAASARKPWLLFTCNEEKGGLGAQAFCKARAKGKLPQGVEGMKFLIELDRKGGNDAVYYDCGNEDFENYISSKGFETAQGSFSDISLIAPELGAAAVNLSSGYHDAHTLHEHINRRELEAAIERVTEIAAEAAGDGLPRFPYVESPLSWGWYGLRDVPGNLPEEYAPIYEDLLCLYPAAALEAYRRKYGNRMLERLHRESYGAL